MTSLESGQNENSPTMSEANGEEELPGSASMDSADTADSAEDGGSTAPAEDGSSAAAKIKKKQPKSDRAKKWKNRLAKKAAARTSTSEENDVEDEGATEKVEDSAAENGATAATENTTPAEVIAVEDANTNMTVTTVKEDPLKSVENAFSEAMATAERLVALETIQQQAEEHVQAVADDRIQEVIAVEDANANMTVTVKEDPAPTTEEPTPEKIAEAQRLVQAEHALVELQAQEQAADQEAEEIAEAFQNEIQTSDEVVQVDSKEQLLKEEAAIETKEAEMEAEKAAADEKQAAQDAKDVQAAVQEQIEHDIQEDATKSMDEIEAIRAQDTKDAGELAPIEQDVQEETTKSIDEIEAMRAEMDSQASSAPPTPGAAEELKAQNETEAQVSFSSSISTEGPSPEATIASPKEATDESAVAVPTEKEQSEVSEDANKEAVAEDTANEAPTKPLVGAEEEKPSNGETTLHTKEIPTISEEEKPQNDNNTPKLIVLIATQSFGNPTQRANQDRAMAMVNSKFRNDHVEVVDGTDPTNKERRNELFEISGIRAKYPQFFSAKDCATTFLGDYDWIEGANETGSLSPKALLGVDVPEESENDLTSVPEATERSVKAADDETAATNVSPGFPKVILLVSKTSGSLSQRTNQDRAMAMLKGKLSPEGELEEVDGSHAANKDRRNTLFGISGIRAQYPQFFLQTSEKDISFLGDYDWLEYLNESGSLTKTALLGEKTSTIDGDSKENDEPAETAPKLQEMKEEKQPRPQLIVLISKSSGVLKQRTNQDRAMGMLKGKFQVDDMEIVDGSDWANAELRNNLFEISGVRGNYPQFFFKNKEGTELSFLGDFEWIENANEQGQLSKAIIFDGIVDKKIDEAKKAKETTTATKEATKGESPAPVSEETPIDRSLAVATDIDVAEEAPSTPASKAEATIDTAESPEELKSASTWPATEPAKTKPPPARSASGSTPTPPTEINGKRMLLLISSFGGGVKQKANQFRAKNILQSGRPGSKITPEEIDAANPFHKDLIATLTSISGVTDKFPQVFLKDTMLGTYTYVGGVATLEKHHKSGTVASIFGGDENVSKTANKSSSTKTKARITSTSTSRALDLYEKGSTENGGGDDEEEALPLVHIAVAVLGVAVGIGMWFSSRREMPR